MKGPHITRRGDTPRVLLRRRAGVSLLDAFNQKREGGGQLSREKKNVRGSENVGTVTDGGESGMAAALAK
jgi:hypothetical protein